MRTARVKLRPLLTLVKRPPLKRPQRFSMSCSVQPSETNAGRAVASGDSPPGRGRPGAGAVDVRRPSRDLLSGDPGVAGREEEEARRSLADLAAGGVGGIEAGS